VESAELILLFVDSRHRHGIRDAAVEGPRPLPGPAGQARGDAHRRPRFVISTSRSSSSSPKLTSLSVTAFVHVDHETSHKPEHRKRA